MTLILAILVGTVGGALEIIERPRFWEQRHGCNGPKLQPYGKADPCTDSLIHLSVYNPESEISNPSLLRLILNTQSMKAHNISHPQDRTSIISSACPKISLTLSFALPRAFSAALASS